MGPQSIPNITLSKLKDEARNAFTASGLTDFPLSGDQYAKWLQTVDPKTAAAIDSKLDYIQDFYRFKDMKDLVAKDAVIGTLARANENDNYHHDHYENYYNSDLLRQVKVPDGYSQMEWIGRREIQETNIERDKIQFVIETASGTYQAFEVNKKDLIALDREKWRDEIPEPLILKNESAMLVVNGFTLYVDGESDLILEGLLLTR